jgi:hypothetical protein
MHKHRMAICSKCNRSQFERRKPCIDGERHHDFIRIGVIEYEEELEQIWNERK